MFDLKKIINELKTIVIGAGAGLSSAAGFEYGGNTFLNNFKYPVLPKNYLTIALSFLLSCLIYPQSAFRVKL